MCVCARAFVVALTSQLDWPAPIVTEKNEKNWEKSLTNISEKNQNFDLKNC